ncbi:MAG: SRPBCC family protein [Myxococcota bacterium]
MVFAFGAAYGFDMEIARSFTVDVPVERAWSVLADEFHDVGNWACGIQVSRKLSEEGPAGIANRQCVVDGMGTITERVTAFDQNARTFSYTVIEGAPGMMRSMGNTWWVESKGVGQTEIRFCIRAEMKPIPAFMMGWMMKRQMNKMCDQICEDLCAYIETGAASDKKQQQLAKAA